MQTIKGDPAHLYTWPDKEIIVRGLPVSLSEKAHRLAQ
jgi:hypothetical protein